VKNLQHRLIRAFQITAPFFRNTIAFQGLVLFAASFTGGIHLAIGNDGRALFQVLLAAGVYAFIVVITTDWWGIDGD